MCGSQNFVKILTGDPLTLMNKRVWENQAFLLIWRMDGWIVAAGVLGERLLVVFFSQFSFLSLFFLLFL